MGTGPLWILPTMPTQIVQRFYGPIVISNEGTTPCYLDNDSGVNYLACDYILRPGDRIIWKADTPCWAIAGPAGNALISLSANVTEFSSASSTDFLTYNNWVVEGGGLGPPPGGYLPPGGFAGDILIKASDLDYDCFWTSLADLLGGGGTAPVVATAPYPVGGTVTTYTDPITGYDYRVHTFLYSGSVDNFTVTNPVVGTLQLQAGGAAGDDSYTNGVFTFEGPGGGAGAFYQQPYILTAGGHTLYVGRRGINAGVQQGEDTNYDGYPGNITATTFIARGGGQSDTAGGSGGGGYGLPFGGVNPGGAATLGSLDGGGTTSTDFKGAAGSTPPTDNHSSGDGGGASGAGSNGLVSTITGAAITMGVGGQHNMLGSAPVANTGSGGRGALAGAGQLGEDGTNGVVRIAYRTS